jgi:cytochrome P450
MTAVSKVDPFSREFLSNPYPFHEELRETAPVVWLDRYDIWAMARHEEVRACLMDWETFCSSAGVGLSDFRKETPWRPPSLILEADPPLHTRTRAVLTRILSAAAMKKLWTTFEQDVVRLVDRLVERGTFDAIKDLAEVYPLKVFPDAVGLEEEGRENLLPYGNMAFNAFGPRNDLFHQAMANAQPVINWISSKCRRAALAPDGLGAQIYAAADAGALTEDEASLLGRSFLTAGLDTTVVGLGNALFCFAHHPEQWQRLRQDPSLARAGVRLGEGEKVLLFLAAANRDARRWEDPDRVDITRRATGHLAFGVGIHGCVGMAVARLEAEIVLTLLARKTEAIELDGEPERRLNNTLRGLARLPLRVRPS